MEHWGIETIIDLFDCNHELITNKDYIELFSKKLVKQLDMEPFGEPVIVRFGKEDKAGYTLVQLIQTSNITAHFSEDTNSAYINIFSCKDYDTEKAAMFAFDFFESFDMDWSVKNRG
jgi:S-adenosylmethionine/arginine decarboxylase-like enzyme